MFQKKIISVIATLVLALAVPVVAIGATTDAYSVYQKFVSTDSGEDGRALITVTSNVVDSKTDLRAVVTVSATSTSLGGNVECATAVDTTTNKGKVGVKVHLDMTCLNVGGEEYLRVDDAWMRIGKEQSSLANTKSGANLIGKWFRASTEDTVSDEDTAATVGILTEKELFSLGKKDAKFTIKEVGGETMLTIKPTTKSKIVKNNPSLKGATFTMTGDITTGEVSKVGLSFSVKRKNIRVGVEAFAKSLGPVPVGTVISAPTGKVGSAEAFEKDFAASAVEASGLLLPTYESEDDRFSVKFSGVPDIEKDIDRKESRLVRTYTVENEDTLERIFVESFTDGELFLIDDEENDRVFASRIEEFKGWWGKKSIVEEEEVKMEGFRGQRVVINIKKEKLYGARLYFCTEEQCFDLVAVAPTQDDAETRLDRLTDTLDFWY